MIEPTKKAGPFLVEGGAEPPQDPPVADKQEQKTAGPTEARVSDKPAEPKKPSRIAGIATRRGWGGKAVKPSAPSEGAEDDRPQQSIVPHASVASTSLTLVVAIMTFLASLTLGADRAPVFLSVLLIWLAWVLVMVVVARALPAASPTLTMRRWSRAICAMGTTVPWFGFATAQMMAE